MGGREHLSPAWSHVLVCRVFAFGGGQYSLTTEHSFKLYLCRFYLSEMNGITVLTIQECIPHKPMSHCCVFCLLMPRPPHHMLTPDVSP